MEPGWRLFMQVVSGAKKATGGCSISWRTSLWRGVSGTAWNPPVAKIPAVFGFAKLRSEQAVSSTGEDGFRFLELSRGKECWNAGQRAGRPRFVNVCLYSDLMAPQISWKITTIFIPKLWYIHNLLVIGCNRCFQKFLSWICVGGRGWVFSDARVVASILKHLVKMLIQQTSWEGTLPQPTGNIWLSFIFQSRDRFYCLKSWEVLQWHSFNTICDLLLIMILLIVCESYMILMMKCRYSTRQPPA